MQTTEPTTNLTEAPTPGTGQVAKQWAIIELMGHARIAGAVSQQVFGGANLVRVDVPAVHRTDTTWRNGGDAVISRVIPAHSRSFGAAAIYSINWCDELAAAATSIQHEPISPYSLKAALASLPDHEQHRLLALTAGATSTAGGDDDHQF